jgi:hypothetical protein
MVRLTVAVVICLGLFCSAAESKLFGFTLDKRSVVFSTIDEVTGKQVKDTFEVPYESLCQGLSAMDSAHGIAYVLGYNNSDRKPNLVGMDIKSGKVAVDIELPFTETGLVGVGQAIDVDPTTGDIIAMGQGSIGTTLTHHYAVRVDYKTKTIVTLANISKDVPSMGVLNGMGGGNTLDYTRNVEYINLAVNISGAIDVATIRIDLKTGKSTIVDKENSLNGLNFDAKSDRIFGWGPSIAPPPNGTALYSTIAAWQSALAAKPIHTLAYLNAADGASTGIQIVGGIPGYFLLEAAVVTVDPVARRLYSLLQPVTNNPGWAPSTDCAKGPFPCGTGTKCCEDPASKTKAGACYKVTDCGNIHDGGGINMTLPFQLVGVDLATAAVTTHPDLCTLAKNDCPWDIDAAAALDAEQL